MATSLEDFTNSNFWRGCAAEFIGTLYLVLMGCGVCLRGPDWQNAEPDVLQIAVTFGLAVATAVWSLAHVSHAGHINPAVTVGMFVTLKISILRAVLFIVSQCVGAIVGAGILYGLAPDHERTTLGVTTVNAHLTVSQAFGVEFVTTFLLVLTVFASCDGSRDDLHGSGPLTIGLCVVICHIFSIKFTGCGLNPARSFGPAVIMNSWSLHWVYWVGPLAGGIVAALLYEVLFAADVSWKKFANLVRKSSSTTATDNEPNPASYLD